ncbi:HEPN domain-containing protein [Paenibacillus sp. CAU 1782]
MPRVPMNSASYMKLKEQIQSSFDFVYVVCQAVPCMKLQASLVQKKQIPSLPSPDYFKVSNSIEQIRGQAQNYKPELCKYILLSSFSYFEAFVIDIVRELIDFHGGSDAFEGRAEQQNKLAINNQYEKYLKEKVALYKRVPNHRDRQRSSSRTLIAADFVFPSQLFSSFGIKMLIEQLGNLKSVDIPKYMKRVFNLELEEEQVKKYHTIRDLRNQIAHGNSVELDLKQVNQMNNELRQIALTIDQHLMNHFFISEEFI